MSNKSEVTIDQYIALGTKYLYSKKYKKSLKEFTKAYNIDNLVLLSHTHTAASLQDPL